MGLRYDNGCKLLRGNREIVAAPANLDRDRVAFVDESAGTVVGDVDEDFCLLAEISDIAQFPLASSAASLERLKRALSRHGCYRDAVGVPAVNPDRAGVVETAGEPFAWLCTSHPAPHSGVKPASAT